MPSPQPARDPRDRIEDALDRRLPGSGFGSPELGRAMRYAVMGPGKRLRPRLVYAAGHMLDIPVARLDGPACAVEMMHAYSLIHDDLPAMDDDRLRRGKPTVHIAFGAATAILAGDALQSLAFELLASDTAIGDDPGTRQRLAATLSRACGGHGMVAGQALDMAAEGKTVTVDELEQIHRLKTGQLLRACVLLAADFRPDLAAEQRSALASFGEHIGLAFQVRDDILDVTAATEQLGKTQGADQAHDKATYPALLGLDGARAYADELYRAALDALTPFGEAAGPLHEIARLLIHRDH